MGLLLAYRLAESGLAPTLITRTKNQQKSISQNGLRLELTSASAVYLSCKTIEQWKKEDLSSWDWVFVTVKQSHIDHLLMEIRDSVNLSSPNWLFMQNGLGHLEAAAKVMDQTRIYCGVTTEAARRVDERTVLHTGSGQTRIGPAFRSAAKPVIGQEKFLKNLCNQMNAAGFCFSVSKNIHSDMWEKLLINAVINPLTGITGVHNGELLASPELFKLMQSLFREGKDVAEAERVDVAADLWQRLLSTCEQTAKNRSSMLQDIDQGRTTEIDWINGSIIARAKHHRISVPTHLTLYYLIKGLPLG